MPRRVRYHLSMPGVHIEADDGPTFRALVDRLLGRASPVETPLGQSDSTRAITPPALTDREREIAQLICEGLTTVKIAAQLNVDPATIKSHRRNMNKKLGSTSRQTLEAKRAEWDR